MPLLLLAYLGGMLTIASPCILPVLPFVFARADQPFSKSGLPLLAGMALTFALVATLAAVGGGWVVVANQYGRWAALALMAVFGLALLSPRLADRLARPLVAAGARLSEASGNGTGARPGASFLLGIATGLLWAPCAGPILGLILTGAALRGASTGTSLLLLAYAAGAASSLALALLAGGRVFTAMKRSLGVGEWIRKGLGAAMLAGVAAIALGFDSGALARLSSVSTGGIEQSLVERFAGRRTGDVVGDTSATAVPAADIVDEGALPRLDGAVEWLNGPPLSAEGLRGKVVLIDFWTYSCINCLRALPYVETWAEKYRDKGLVVIGVHAPEFAFERDVGNVKRAIGELGITYPVAIDNDYAIWKAFGNQYWPAHYLVDAKGRIRHHHFGEGDYAATEQAIQSLLREAGARDVAGDTSVVEARGIQRAATGDARSPETYLGYGRGERFASGPVLPDARRTYAAPADPDLDHWGLVGDWSIGSERATLAGPTGRIIYRFQARDVHLVLGPGPDGRPVRFRVSVDGGPPGAAHGVDAAPDGSGTVSEQRLYQILREPGAVAPHTVTIEFEDPGVSAYAFTFG